MKYFLFFITLLSFTMPAQAHRPYLVKKNTIAAPSNMTVITEKLYGDGIFTADPVSFQLRNTNGAVLAYTPVASHVATFCPHIKFCWAFPYGPRSILTIGLKLDYQTIDWLAQQPPPSEDITGIDPEESTSYEKYLKDKRQKITRSHNFGYPEMRSGAAMQGFSYISPAIVLSPLFIIADQFFPLALLAALTLSPFLLHWIFFKRLRAKRKVNQFLLQAAGTFLIFSNLGLAFSIFAILSFTFSAPIFYLFAIPLAIILTLYRRKKLNE